MAREEKDYIMSDYIRHCTTSIALCISMIGCGGRDNPYDYSDRNSYSQFEIGVKSKPDIYCNCGTTTATQSSIPEAIEQIDLVDGVLVKVAWKDIEPAPGVFDFTLIDSQLSLAETKGISVSLAITNGPDAPAWLANEGAVYFEYTSITDGSLTAIPLLWDAVYLTRYKELIVTLGERYDGNSAFRLLHMTQSTTTGFDSQFLFSPVDMQRFVEAGYTPDLYLESWKEVINTFAESFSYIPVDMDVHPVFGNTDLPFTVAQYGLDTLHERFGVFATWWSYDNAEVVYPEMFSLVSQVAERTFATVQLVAPVSEPLNSTQITNEQFLSALELAKAVGVSYVEVWKQDLYNSDLMQQYSDSLNASFNRTIAH